MYGALLVVGGLGITGAILWGLYQFSIRQQKTQDYLAQIEQLSADLLLNAEATMDKVDEKMRKADARLARVDDRITDLLIVADQVQEKILHLEELRRAVAEQVPLLARTTVSVESARPQLPLQPVQRRPEDGTKVGGQAQSLLAKVQGRAVAVSQPEPYAVPPVVSAQPSAEKPGRKAQVYVLADQGKGLQQIALETGIPRGEVELMLRLRNP